MTRLRIPRPPGLLSAEFTLSLQKVTMMPIHAVCRIGDFLTFSRRSIAHREHTHSPRQVCSVLDGRGGGRGERTEAGVLGHNSLAGPKADVQTNFGDL
jgi:hypothetical protein